METKGGPEISKRWLLVFQVLPSDIISEGKEDGDLESNFEALFVFYFAEYKNKKLVASDDRLRTAAPPQGHSVGTSTMKLYLQQPLSRGLSWTASFSCRDLRFYQQ